MKKAISIILIMTTIITGAIIISFHISTSHEKELTGTIRKNLSGSFIKIPQGTIHYNWHGPKKGPVLVMVHGFSTPQFVFDKNVPALVKAGFRVLTFDHFGRGYSDRPEGPYNEDFFDKEMIDLFKALKITKPVYLFGYSLGGGISTVFTARHPEMIKKLIIAAPVGFLDKPSGQNSLLMIPVLGEYLFSVIGIRTYIDAFEKEKQDGIATKRMVKLFKEQFNYKGTWNALLSTFRSYPMDNLKSYYKRVGASLIPVMFIWGAKDETVPFKGAAQVEKAIPHIKKTVIEDGTHSIVYSHPQMINKSTISFLKNKTL